MAARDNPVIYISNWRTKGNASGITELERLGEMQAAQARERELFTQASWRKRTKLSEDVWMRSHQSWNWMISLD